MEQFVDQNNRNNFLNKIDASRLDGCWTWKGAKSLGYGLFAIKRVPKLAHRVSWVNWLGSIPNELWVLHKCDNRSCVRPDHLFLGTHQDNMNDMKNKGRGSNHNQNKIFCKNGHKIDENLCAFEIINGIRRCKICRNKSKKEDRQNKKLALR